MRRFKQEEILRIAARDLGGRISLKDCIQELTNLAQVCLETATAYCYRELVKEKNWDPILLEQKGLVVLGLGKFGGEELNFSSDIDLIFLYQPLADLPFSFGEQREFYQLLTRRITQSMAALMNGDLVFRVDLNLRPGGKDSELALSLESALEYYQSEAQDLGTDGPDQGPGGGRKPGPGPAFSGGGPAGRLPPFYGLQCPGGYPGT